MLSLDRHIAVSAGWIAGPAAGVAIMGAPGALGITSQATSEACFYGGLCVFALTILAVLVHSLRERGSRQDKMWPIPLMASGTLLLLTGATARFWPHARIISGYRGEITGVAAFTVNGQPGLLNVIPVVRLQNLLGGTTSYITGFTLRIDFPSGVGKGGRSATNH